MNQHSPRRGARARWRVLVAVLVTALAAGACVGPLGAGSGPVRVAFGDATAWLATLSPLEQDQQVLDWARVGLASALGASRTELVDQSYDGSPLRSETLDGLADQPVRSGRALRVGDTLHVIVPAGDPSPTTTLAEQLDQYRADHGADAPFIQVHEARTDPATHEVTLTPRPEETATRARTAAGWIEQPVEDAAGLAAFLARADRFSGFQLIDGLVYATGWDEPGRAPDVTLDDVSVLAAGYGHGSPTAPGFSLDPGSRAAADLAAVAPGFSPSLFVTTVDPLDDPYRALYRAVEATLYYGAPPAPGVPTDRAEQWALHNYFRGRPLYSRARYDGGIAGSELAMTLFYTDYVAKNWVAGVGTGVPSTAVPGFVTDPDARTPAGLCPADGSLEAYGRLWFSQNDASFAYRPTGVTVGAQATRLNVRVEGGDDHVGREVQPDYSFGRGMKWWDRNYRAVADYEPQYHRLEQIMRWSGALQWLSTQGRALPTTPPALDPSRSFASWYTAHPELRERAALHPVRPPSAGTAEAVLTVPSRAFDDGCGIQIFGGVSLGDVIERRGGLPPDVPLPGELGRARPADPAATSARSDGVHIVDDTDRTQPAIGYDITRSPDADRVTVTGDPRSPDPAVRLGDGRVLTDTRHTASVTWRGGASDPSAQLAIGDQTVAEMTVAPASQATGGTRIAIAVRSNLETIRNALARTGSDPGAGLGNVQGFRFSYGDGGGTTSLTDGGWMHVGPSGPGFHEDLAAEIVGGDGRPVHFATGEPQQISLVPAGRDAHLIAVPAPSRTVGTVAAAYPAGTPLYTDSPSLFAHTVPAGAKVTVRELRPSGLTAPGLAAAGVVGVAGAGTGLALRYGSGSGPGVPTLPGVLVSVTDCTSTPQAPGCSR